MIESKALIVASEEALSFPDDETLRHQLKAIRQFQAVARAEMVQGHDYGVIPGTQRPTLLKPGAEKIAKLLGLADRYEVVDKTEDWARPLFRYLIRCSLVSMKTGVVVSEGLGECNSMETRYRWRWLWARDVPEGVEKSRLATRKVKTRAGEVVQYRMENDEIFTQVNTILKMSKKRSLVDAALSAGRLSDVFTQDMEDIAPRGMEQEGEEAKHTGGAEPESAPSSIKTFPIPQQQPPPSGVSPAQEKRPWEGFPAGYQRFNKFFNLARGLGYEPIKALQTLGVKSAEEITNFQEALNTLAARADKVAPRWDE